MLHGQSRQDVGRRTKRTDGDLSSFQVRESGNFRIDDEHMIGPLDQNTRDFDRHAAQISRDHRLQYQVVINIAAGQRGDGNIGGDLHKLRVQPFFLEEAFVFGNPAAKKRHIGIGYGDSDLLRIGRVL